MNTLPPAPALPLFRPGRRAVCVAAILACAGPAQALALEAFPSH